MRPGKNGGPGPAAAGALETIDPRARLATALGLIVIAVSGPLAPSPGLAAEIVLMAAAGLALRVPARGVLKRMLAASPFILTAAVMLPLSRSGAPADGAWSEALAMTMKAYASVLALSLLVLSGKPVRLFQAARSLGFPPAFGSVMTITGSYLGILGHEAQRMKRAMDSRTPVGPPRLPILMLAGRTAGMIFIRGWERAGRVQAAMESRGFNGAMPELDPPRLGLRDILAVAAFLLPFIALRLILP